MCLIKKSLIPRIALKDIVVYKLLNTYKGILYTIIVGEVIEIGKEYKGIFKEKDYFNNNSHSPTFIKSLFSKYIDTGYIHSYKTPNRFIPTRTNLYVECIIPKGTLYWVGEDNELASRKLKYVKIL